MYGTFSGKLAFIGQVKNQTTRPDGQVEFKS